VLDDLRRVLLHVCSVVPDGVVIFFPSYNFLETAIKRWQIAVSGWKASVWERLGAKKVLFMESKESKGGEDVLAEYAAAIDGGKGSLLLSVIRGKRSEGINFSDPLGRCAVSVGLPFPNI
jgi:chromosome transmission fidelity protein 1